MTQWKPKLKDVWFEVFVKCRLLVSSNLLSLPVSAFIALSSVSFCAGLFCSETIDSQQLDSVNTASFLRCFSVSLVINSSGKPGVFPLVLDYCLKMCFFQIKVSGLTHFFDFFTHRSACVKSANSRCEQLVFDEKRQNGSVINKNSQNHRSRLDTVAALHLRKGEIHKNRFSAQFFSLWGHEAVDHHRCTQVCPSLR